MMVARQIANRWYGQLTGMLLVAIGIVGLSVPAPTAGLARLECRAFDSVLVPIANKTAVGRQLVAIYLHRDQECRGSL